MGVVSGCGCKEVYRFPQIAATVFVRLEIARNQFFPLTNSWETFFCAPTGCEPVFLTLNRCHNLFPCS